MAFGSGDKVDKYIVDCELGEGGLAVVYKVIHETLEIPYALKVLKVSHPKLRERLLREGRLQAQLQHPNVVSVIDVLEVEGCPGLILEFIDGQSMDDWLHDNQPSLAEAEQVFLQILDALEEAHSKSIIHRDLKPSNVMMMKTRNKLQAKVCDFGLAKALESDGANMTRTGMTMGTPAYMAPEQVRDAKGVDQIADVFSLGAILYELVTGQQAFTGKDTLELLNSVANLPHPPPERVVEGLPQRYINAINGALVKNPSFRIPSCSVFREVLLGERVWQSDQLSENETIVGLNLYGDEVSVAEQISNHDTVPPASSAEEASRPPQNLSFTVPSSPASTDNNSLTSTLPEHFVTEPDPRQSTNKHTSGLLVAAVLFSSLITGGLFYSFTDDTVPKTTDNVLAQRTQNALTVQRVTPEAPAISEQTSPPVKTDPKPPKPSAKKEKRPRPKQSTEIQDPFASAAKETQAPQEPPPQTTEQRTAPVRNTANEKKRVVNDNSSNKNTLLSKALDASLSKDRSEWLEDRAASSLPSTRAALRENAMELREKTKTDMGTISFTYADYRIKDAYLSNGTQRYKKGEVPVGTYDIYLVCEDKDLQDAVGKHTISLNKPSTLFCECDFTTCE